MQLSVYAVTAVALMSTAMAYPTGAPYTACPLLAPLHPNITAQPSRSPYEITASDRFYRPGQPIIVSILGPTFAGFILQARAADGTSSVGAGAFLGNLPVNTRFANCSKSMNDTVTHANPNDKNNLQFVWIAPQENTGTLFFEGAVLFNYSTFWKVGSGPIRSERDVPCLAARETVLVVDVETPTCSADGKYAAKQCRGNRCECVSEDGQSLENGLYSADRSEAEDMHCTCARDRSVYKSKGLVGKTFKCTANGNYDSVQCSGSVCFCASPATGKQILGASPVSIGNTASLKC